MGRLFGEDLAADIVADEVNDIVIAGDKCADGSHRFGESGEIKVDLILAALFFPAPAPVLPRVPNPYCIVNQQAEFIFGFEVRDLFQFALVAGHAEHAFGDHEDTAGVLFC